MDACKMFNWGPLILTFGLLVYLGYLSSKYVNKDDEGGLYKERGFQRRVGFGKRPALVSVDLMLGPVQAIPSPATKRRWITRSFPVCRSSSRRSAPRTCRLST